MFTINFPVNHGWVAEIASFIERHPASIALISARFMGGILMFFLLMSFRAAPKGLRVRDRINQ
jgi:hypothetical protein